MNNHDSSRALSGVARLYGQEGFARLQAASVMVAGLGGVGSWAAEALARTGVGQLVLVDLDNVAVSNINRQVLALHSLVGLPKVEAMRRRILDISPSCQVDVLEDFASADNVHTLPRCDAVIDATDDVRAKAALADWALGQGSLMVMSGAAGGKRLPEKLENSDLSAVTHDRLLANVRHRLRRDYGFERTGAMNIACVHSREQVSERPESGGLACSGYGSGVVVTATFGLWCATRVIEATVQANISPRAFRLPESHDFFDKAPS